MFFRSTTPSAVYQAYRTTGTGFAFSFVNLKFQNDVSTAGLITLGALGSVNLGSTPTLTYMYI
jgi:hypothetical protein